MTQGDNPAGLRKAVDAQVHPMLAAGPSADRVADAAEPSNRESSAPLARAKPAKSGRGKAAKGSDVRASKRAKDRKAARRREKGQRVDLKVKVPKSLRRTVRDLAKSRGVRPDDVVTEILRTALDDR